MQCILSYNPSFQYQCRIGRLNVELSHPDDISVEVDSDDCPSPSDGNMTCSGVTSDERIGYRARITFKKSVCSDENEASVVKISLAGFARDVLTIRLACEVCSCPDGQLVSPVCNRRGRLGSLHKEISSREF